MKRIIFYLLVLSIGYATFFSEKARLDREVKRLCAIDGGIKVYETVKLSAERFTKRGSVHILEKSLAKPGDEFFYESSELYLQKGNPEAWRSHYRVYRALDKKLLGESIRYIRRGGDFPGPWHSSSFGCPERIDLHRRIFIQSSGE